MIPEVKKEEVVKVEEKPVEASVELTPEVVAPVKTIEPVIVSKPVESPVEEVVEVADKVIDKEEIFSLSRPTIEKGPVVIGSIDLNLLNQNTRPKPKTKEQKRKEREDKIKNERRPAVPAVAAVKVEGDDDPNKKKKRERFTNHKVDINKVQANNHEVKKHTPGTPSANPANNNSNAAANNAKKDRFKKPLKTVVNEEEVEKQIKETLARMAGGNKKNKGAVS